jgi:nucleoid-associated protein YgaU
MAQTPPTGDPDTRFGPFLPPSSVVGQETDIMEPPDIPTDSNATPTVAPGESWLDEVKQEILDVEPVIAGWPKFHTVVEGDSLWTIAQKFYGPKEGVKQVNIRGIFEANRPTLTSVDDIGVGQKLVIPAPTAPPSVQRSIASIFPAGLVEHVESIGERHLATYSGAEKQHEWYAVREGDSLWKIAAEQLGNGARYTEIAKLNADSLSDEDSLSVGMRLKLPVQ